MTDDDAADQLERQTEDVKAAIAAARAQLRTRQHEQRQRQQQYNHDYYLAHREKLLEQSKQHAANRRAADPERIKAQQRERANRYYQRHKERLRAKRREDYHLHPEREKVSRDKYYAEHADQVRARHRDRAPVKNAHQRAARRERRDLERRVSDLGLPPPQPHVTTARERFLNERDADAFFTREWSPDDLEQMRRTSIATPPELLAAWVRDCTRARATHRLSEKRDELARLHQEIDRGAQRDQARRAEAARRARAEEKRLDDIGRQINDQLRQTPRRHQQPDPAAPHPMLQPQQSRGMNR
ncbi:hypothetical protein [Microbacterium sp.]|uniref:hypothetical protein n=1 Tax=Microbacterium sp. TaxID=51671 RepID=UPI003A94DC73